MWKSVGPVGDWVFTKGKAGPWEEACVSWGEPLDWWRGPLCAAHHLSPQPKPAGGLNNPKMANSLKC